ncbi:MAG: DegT/DnrJ/EryC1/StrS family aminotransferase [Oligoflexia bacterium]|nr:DegT/DnrJ/EryC1/StrS family aminotransferase [Oligoflexia bacterium]
MEIKFNNPKAGMITHEREILSAVERVFQSGWYLLGKELENFEKEFSNSLGLKSNSAVGCNSGTDALVLSLKVLGVKEKDQVIVSSHTAIPTITAIRSLGAEPKFCDCDPETWVMNTEQANSLVNNRTKAVIAVHIYGNSVDLDKLSKVQSLLIEDVAQAQGSAYKGRALGTMGAMGAFSFYPTKNLGALGDGGAVVNQDGKFLDQLKMLRFYGQKDRYIALEKGGINSRLDEIQAAILREKLKLIEQQKLEKARLVEKYKKELNALPIRFQKITPNCEPNWHLFVVRLETGSLRDQLAKFLLDKGIQTGIHYPLPNHQQKIFSDYKTDLPETEKLAKEILSIPMYPGLKTNEQEYIIEQITAFYK